MRFYNTPVKRTKIHEYIRESMDIEDETNTITGNFMGFADYFKIRSQDICKPFTLLDFLDSLAGIIAFPIIFIAYPIQILLLLSIILLIGAFCIPFNGCCCANISKQDTDFISRNLAIAFCATLASISAICLEIVRFVCGTAASVVYLSGSIFNCTDSENPTQITEDGIEEDKSKTQDLPKSVIIETLDNSQDDINEESSTLKQTA